MNSKPAKPYDYWYWHSKREAVLKRDRHCVYCRTELSKLNATIDHLIPQCKGGHDELDNLALACKKCNNEKQDMLPLNFLLTRCSR